ncbi:hypothetical protein OG205_24535 [Lentzea sp. NBC_00516]|uniref:hypothetical protein n=1 Tax=Lentzea sp. NBC_00516 TaxID=2903582 RepID=UPI002E81E1CA|nr:hypothetical protein [Lentzea sp. NBC_00516]WUD21308.1 hypothetical protein OG205_24535 [Lentzea sp. NBC_00516]
MRRKRKIFILWVRGDLSRVVVPVLDLELRRHKLDVEMDRVLKTSNRASLAQWMANNIENLVVICVVTPELAALFNCDEDAPPQEHKGGQWEIRMLIQRLYEHGMGDGCPVIPVLPPGVDAEDGPMILRGLENTRFDHVTGEGIDTIVKRVHNAYDHSEGVVLGRLPAEDKTQVPTQPWDGLTEKLRHVDPCHPHAYEIGMAWVRRALKKGVSHSSDLLPVFKRIRLAAFRVDDLVLLEQITDICLKAVEQLDLDDESRVEKCTYLLNKAFVLCCNHKLSMAQVVAEQAYGLACAARDAASIARAKRCLAFIHVRLAGFRSGEARAEEVARARVFAVSAMNQFQSVDSEDKHLAALAMAEVHFTEYRYERNKRSLDEAARFSAEAAKGFSDQKFHWYDEARLLQSAVAFEQGGTAGATKLLDETLLDLRARAERAEACTELLANGHLLRARFWVPRRRGDAQVEIGAARAIFDKLNRRRMVAECDWLSFTCDRKRYRFGAYDIRALERNCPNPVRRLKVARRGRTWSVIGGLLWGRIDDKYWKRAIQETPDDDNDEC